MDRWTNEIDRITTLFKDTFSHLTLEQLNWKQHPDRWSIGQNIEHLILINESYYPILKSLHTGTYHPPFIAKLGFMVSFFGKMILKSVEPKRQRKIKTFPIWQPTQSAVDGTILAQFEQHQQTLKDEIIKAKKLLDTGTIISSPANKNVVYKLETAFDVIIHHELRHLEQAKEVVSLIKP